MVIDKYFVEWRVFMKKMMLVILCTVLLIGITGCGKTMSDNAELNEVKGVSMTIKEGTLTKTSATIIISDTNKKGTYVYGESFRIDKKENGKWKEMKITGDGGFFNAIAYYVDENGKLEMKQNWYNMYGELKKGEYRLVKDTFLDSTIPITESDKLYFFVEFNID